jgi:hypothetical protein
MLGELDLAPMQQVLRNCEIRDGAVMAAGGTEYFGMIAADEPIAHIIARIGAKAKKRLRHGERAPQAVRFLQSGHHLLLRQIAQAQPAALARRILEIERLPAILAFKQFHPGSVTRGLDPRVHPPFQSLAAFFLSRWIAGSSPAMTPALSML